MLFRLKAQRLMEQNYLYIAWPVFDTTNTDKQNHHLCEAQPCQWFEQQQKPGQMTAFSKINVTAISDPWHASKPG